MFLSAVNVSARVSPVVSAKLFSVSCTPGLSGRGEGLDALINTYPPSSSPALFPRASRIDEAKDSNACICMNKAEQRGCEGHSYDRKTCPYAFGHCSYRHDDMSNMCPWFTSSTPVEDFAEAST